MPRNTVRKDASKGGNGRAGLATPRGRTTQEPWETPARTATHAYKTEAPLVAHVYPAPLGSCEDNVQTRKARQPFLHVPVFSCAFLKMNDVLTAETLKELKCLERTMASLRVKRGKG